MRIHEGSSQTGLYSECTGASGALLPILAALDAAVSVVVWGHTHKAYDCVIDGRLVTSAAHAGRIITDIDLTHDERTGRITSQDARNVIVTRDVARDAAQTALIALIAHYETGAQRDSMLEQQWQLANGVEKANLLSVSFGFSYDWSASAPLGTRIDPASIRLDGAVIDPAASYRITVDSLLAAGGADDQPGDPAALTAQVSAG